MAEYNLGNAHGKIVIDSDTSGIGKAEEGLQRVGKAGMSTEQALDKTANAAGAAGLGIAAGLGMAVKTAATFEQGLSAIQAVSGATASEMEKVHDKALQIGSDTAFGATEAASAMEELAKAGLTLDEILGGAADATVALAAAGGVDMPTAATIASNAMNQFGLAAKDMVNVSDLIAGAANASAIDVTDFGMSMSQVGAVANLAGLSFEDTAVAIAEMGNAGIKGSDAGTSLKTMLSNLQPTTKAQIATMKELGLMTEDGTNKFYDQNGELRGLADIQGLLKGATDDLSAAEKQMALETIFGSDAIRAAAVMAEEGAVGYQKMNDAMNKTTAAEVAKVRMDNLMGAIEEMKGAGETLAITIGEQLTPYIRTFAEGLGSLLGWFNSLSPETQKYITLGLVLAAGLLLVTAAVLKTVMMFRTMILTMKTLGILSTATQAGFIKMAATAVASFVKMTLSATANAARMAAIWAAHGARMAVYYLADAARAAAHAARVGAITAAHAARMGLYYVAMAASATLNAAKVAAAWLLANGAAAARALVSLGIAVATTVGGWVVMAVTAMANAVIMAAAWFIALGPIGWAIAALIAIGLFIWIFWDDVKAAFQKAGAWIAEKMKWLWNEVVKIWNNIIAFFQAIPGKVSAVFSGALNWLTAKGADILAGLWMGAKNMWASYLGWLLQIGGWVKNALSGAASWLVSAGGDLLRGLWNGVAGMQGWLLSRFSGLVKNITSSIKSMFGIGSPSKLMEDEVGQWLPPGIAIGIDSAADEAIRAAEALSANVAGSLSMSPGGSDAFWDASALGVGYVPPSAEVASYAASQGDATPGHSFTTNIYNPVAEKASDSEARRLRALSDLGAF